MAIRADIVGIDSPEALERALRSAYYLADEGLATVTALLDRVLRDTDAMERLLLHLSVSVTSMFRAPSFYVSFREKVVPLLRTHPFVRLWHVGCSTAQVVYSLPILHEEIGIYER